MKIINLMENTRGRAPYCEHGLSFYIETDHHMILMDTGQSFKTVENAKSLGIDLDKVDLVILSHGHYDHTGGVTAFRKINKHAVIYMQKDAILPHYHFKAGIHKYIGIDPHLLDLEPIVLLEGSMKLDEEIEIMTGVKGHQLTNRENDQLEVYRDGRYLPDDFHHEQYLIIHNHQHHYLFSGCAHKGIVNIMEHYRELYGEDPDLVISGFHLVGDPLDLELIQQTAEALNHYQSHYYTGHCTGEEAFSIMKGIMNHLDYVHAGEEIEAL